MAQTNPIMFLVLQHISSKGIQPENSIREMNSLDNKINKERELIITHPTSIAGRCKDTYLNSNSLIRSKSKDHIDFVIKIKEKKHLKDHTHTHKHNWTKFPPDAQFSKILYGFPNCKL